MALSTQEATQLANELPEGMSCANARERILFLVEMLERLTDDAHVLSNADIRAILRAYSNGSCDPAENTINADLHAIAASGCLGIELHFTPSGVWCARTQLTPAKVRLLLNAVQSSRSLTVEQSFDLQEDLFNLVSRHQEDDLSAQVHVDQRVRKYNQQVFETIDTVATAMRTERRIEFQYTYSDFNGKAIVLPGDDGNTWRRETPIALYYSEGNYYVETYSSDPWRHGIEFMMSRADRMVGARVSTEPAEKCRAIYNARRSVRKRMEQEFDMVGGPQRTIFLRVRADRTNVFFDRFGFNTKLAQFEGTMGDPEATGLTMVTVAQSFTFYRWLSASGDGIVVSEPPSEIGLRSGPWARRLKGISREELMEDYRNMVEGFLTYLDAARAPYTKED